MWLPQGLETRRGTRPLVLGVRVGLGGVEGSDPLVWQEAADWAPRLSCSLPGLGLLGLVSGWILAIELRSFVHMVVDGVLLLGVEG